MLTLEIFTWFCATNSKIKHSDGSANIKMLTEESAAQADGM